MKRIIAAILVCVMVVMCGTVYAVSKPQDNQLYKLMAQMKELYDISPNALSKPSSIMNTYLLLKMFVSNYQSELMQEYGLAEDKDERRIAYDYYFEKCLAYENMLVEPGSIMRKWMQGDLTDSECAEQLMKCIGNVMTEVEGK